MTAYIIKSSVSLLLIVWALLVPVKKGKALCFQQVFPGSISSISLL